MAQMILVRGTIPGCGKGSFTALSLAEAGAMTAVRCGSTFPPGRHISAVVGRESERMKRLTLAFVAFAVIDASAQTVELPPASMAGRVIRALVAEAPAELRDAYAGTGYQPFWSRDEVVTPQAEAIITILGNAAMKGLDARDYDAADLPLRAGSIGSEEARAEFDVALTDALFRYVNDVSRGRVAPEAVDFDFESQPKPFYFPSLVERASVADEPSRIIADVEPRHPEYHALLEALERYRALAKNDPGRPLPVAVRVAPGEHYAGLERLAALLRELGDLSHDATVGELYEGAIVDAVRGFQSRHALDPDGILGRATFAQLNVPLVRRVAQLEWALERWRWAPRSDEDVVLINVPSYRLEARGSDGTTLTMRVVVGESARHRTPMFDGLVRNVVFRPYWGVTPNIQRNEIVPKVEGDRSWLARNNYELVDGGVAIGSEVSDEQLARLRSGSLRVRQKPGATNALGLVKFLFPNDSNIYLHSTPQPALFARARRDFSHGCIRVEEPAALAAWMLRDQQWSEKQASAAMHGDRDDMYIRVTRPVRVVLTYATASADARGRVEFYDDIYRHDVQLASLLAPPAAADVAIAAK